MALLANYSMHYFGAGPISADYYGDFVRIVSKRLADGDPSFIAMMSHGTSGDQQEQEYQRRHHERAQRAACCEQAPDHGFLCDCHENTPANQSMNALTITHAT